jgi:hypothetical protein
MKRSCPADPEWSEIEPVAAPRPCGLGNLSYRVSGPAGTYLLKLYRRRWGRLQELIEPWYSRYVLRRTSGTAEHRFRSERDNLAVWRREGFDVCRSFDLPLPRGIDPPALWLEYVPGRLLLDALADPDMAWGEKAEYLAALSRELGRRHARALATGERRLLQKHGTASHVMLYGSRLITFDLEGAYLPGHALDAALVRELAGYLRSFLHALRDRVDDGIEAFAAAYPEPALLRDALDHRLLGRSVLRRLARYRDRRRRGEGSKFGLLARLRLRLP